MFFFKPQNTVKIIQLVVNSDARFIFLHLLVIFSSHDRKKKNQKALTGSRRLSQYTHDLTFNNNNRKTPLNSPGWFFFEPISPGVDSPH